MPNGDMQTQMGTQTGRQKGVTGKGREIGRGKKAARAGNDNDNI